MVETGRSLRVRMKEHRHYSKQGLVEKSSITQHVFEKDNKTRSSDTILQTEHNWNTGNTRKHHTWPSQSSHSASRVSTSLQCDCWPWRKKFIVYNPSLVDLSSCLHRHSPTTCSLSSLQRGPLWDPVLHASLNLLGASCHFPHPLQFFHITGI
jgi:hypothetical protein